DRSGHRRPRTQSARPDHRSDRDPAADPGGNGLQLRRTRPAHRTAGVPVRARHPRGRSLHHPPRRRGHGAGLPVGGAGRNRAAIGRPPWLVLVGTGIIGLAITLGNIVVPVIIRREVPWEQVSMVTGLYSAMMNIGSMATLIGTGPLAAALGWRWALATWGVLALIGLGFW